MILTVTLNPAVDKVYKVENFAVGKVSRAKEVAITAGGKGINVARVCSILGEEVIATGFLGGDSGEFIHDAIREDKILDSFIDIDGETRTSITISDLLDNTSTEILESGPYISGAEQREFIHNFIKLAEAASVVVLSGSIPRGVDPKFYTRLIDIANEKDKKVILDTSGLALKEGIRHIPYMIKPNFSELRAITGKSLTDRVAIENEACAIQQEGIELVCITLDKDGAIAAYDGDIFRVDVPAIDVINTVGCGDAFVAGCAIGYIRGYDIQKTLRYATACGMANTQFLQPGRVEEGLVKEFYREVSISKEEFLCQDNIL